MTLDLAMRVTEVMLALAIIQQGAEHLRDKDRALFALRIALCL